jgi:hypothetical protein
MASTLSGKSLGLVKKYLCRILDESKTNGNFRTRLDQIDRDYARYQEAVAKGDQNGIDQAGSQPCGVGLNETIVNPVVISQVDSMVSYWAEVFLSGSPIFPVVSTPQYKGQAEALEGIVQDHMILSESIPKIQLMLKDAGKYNFFAAEVEWAPMKTYKPFLDIADMSGEGARMTEGVTSINYINRLNPRNVHWDTRIPLADVDLEGEFAGYSKIFTRMGLKDLLNRLTNDGTLVSPQAAGLALSSGFDSSDYYDDPIVSNWATGAAQGGVNWDRFGGWLPPMQEGLRKVPETATNTYVVHTFYVRLVPSDFDMRGVPNKNSVQVWKLRMVNRSVVISAEPYTGAMGRLGIFLGTPIEDGMDLQTQSYAEMATPIQNATTRLFNARFHMAKRAISDRALYNPDLIRSSDINSPIPSAKIPVKAGKLKENPLSSAYMQIPFDSRGSETFLQDAMLINEWQKELSGQNSASRGQFTKGNRTLGEFSTIMGSAENRMRLPALVLEYRLFTKIKEQLKLNLLQFGETTQVISPRNGKPLEVNIEELKKLRLQFEMADGYTPKSKLANTDLLVSIMQMVMNSPLLAQMYGSQLPGMLAHMAQLGGLRGFEQYAEAALEQHQNIGNFQLQLVSLMQQLQQNGQISPEQAQQVEQAGQQEAQQ